MVLPPHLAIADDAPHKKEDRKPDPPRAAVVLPFGLKIGATNKVVIRGQNLTNVTELRFTNEAVKAGVILGRESKAEVPKEADARKVGDTQITAEILLPAGTPAGTNWFTLTSPDGTGEPRPLVFLSAAELIDETEPNGGFREAQAVSLVGTVSGNIKESGDVDVFRMEGAAGKTIRLEVLAAAAGSALDSLVTVYDAAGHILAANDDSATGRDSVLQVKLPKDGPFFASIVDAGDKGGPTHVYLLSVRAIKTDSPAPVPSPGRRKTE